MSRLKCKRELFEAEAVAMSLTFPEENTHVTKIMIAFDAAPSTSEDLTVTLDSAGGSDYDTVLLTKDPASEDVSGSLVIDYDDNEMKFSYNDGIDIAYTNTDAADIAVSVYYEVTP